MTFRIVLDSAAQRDFVEIEAWLDENAPGQADRFIADFDATCHVIAGHALLRTEIRPHVRHESMRVFRYHLWYRAFPSIEVAEVFAILHHRRGPEAWEKRL